MVLEDAVLEIVGLEPTVFTIPVSQVSDLDLGVLGAANLEIEDFIPMVLEEAVLEIVGLEPTVYSDADTKVPI